MTNTCDIDSLKKQMMQDRGLSDQVKDRPGRTFCQALAFIFGKKGVTLGDLIRPDGSGRGRRPELTFDLMIEACVDEFKENEALGGPDYQKCDSFVFNKKAKDD